MKHSLPTHIVLPRPEHWNPAIDPGAWPWHEIALLRPFLLADGSGAAIQQTSVRVCHAQAVLYVRFDCQDRDIWGTYTERDDPIYDEEVVEIFLAPGHEDPTEYIELEVSPHGVLLDATVRNPGGGREHLKVDFEWRYEGLQWEAGTDVEQNQWWALLQLPLAEAATGATPRHWRANFYRIERPRDGDDEFSCWSPTLTSPADFHKPERFGHLELG